MTVSTQTAKSQATGNGVTTAFTGSFPILDETHVTVIVTTSGVDSTKVLNTDYTISGVGGSTFTVTFGTAPASGARVTIARNVPLTQELDLTPNAALPSDQLEESYDKAVMIDQQTNEKVGRALRQPITDATAIEDLPATATRATKVLAFDADGDPVASTMTLAAIEAGATNAAASAVAAAASASAASTSASAAAAAQTAAETAETNAETAETNAETAQAAAESAASAVAIPFTFDATTSMADPGTGDFRFNSATVASVTAIALSDLSADTGNPDVSAFVATWDDSTNTNKGTLTLKKRGTPATFATFTVTGLTDNSGWTELAVTHVASNGSWSASDVAYVQFTRAGDKGVDGAGSLTQIDAGFGLSANSNGTAGGNITSNGTLKIAGVAFENIASAATLNLANITGPYINITGSVNISGVEGLSGKPEITAVIGNGTPTLVNSSNWTIPGGNQTMAAGNVLRIIGTGNASARVLLDKADGTAPVSSSSTPQILHVRDEKTAGTAGGDFNSGAWRTRTLNTVVTNTIASASLSSNQITLPAGTYDLRARGPINGTKQTKSRIYNTSDSADAIIGATGYSHSANDTFDDVLVWGRITIASSKTFELQQWCNTTVSTNGFGLPANIDSKVEVYAEVWVEKVA
jgi:hypothetical protein